jgi:hypothetical protein
MNLIHSLILFLTTLFHIVLTQRGQRREHTSNDYINLSINRTIDLTTPIFKIESKILIKSMKVDPIYSYRLPIMKNSSKYLVNLSAKLQSASEDEIINLKVNKQSFVADDTFDYYEINFKSEPMNYEEERILIVGEEYFERFQLLPKKITIKEDQLVLFVDTVNHISFYQTNTQTTTVTMPHERTNLM